MRLVMAIQRALLHEALDVHAKRLAVVDLAEQAG